MVRCPCFCMLLDGCRSLCHWCFPPLEIVMHLECTRSYVPWDRRTRPRRWCLPWKINEQLKRVGKWWCSGGFDSGNLSYIQELSSMFIDKSVFIPGLSNISKSISRIKARWFERCRDHVSFQKFSKSAPFYSSVMLWPDQFQDKYRLFFQMSLVTPGYLLWPLCSVLALRMNNFPSSFSMHPKHAGLEPAIDPYISLPVQKKTLRMNFATGAPTK